MRATPLQGRRAETVNACCASGRPACGGRCCSLDEVCASGVCSLPCGIVQESGSNTPVIRTINLGSTSGWFKFFWNNFTVPDRLILRSAQGMVLWDTGCVGGSNGVCLFHSGTTTAVQIEVVPNCSGTPSTDWTYTITCPTFSSEWSCIVG